MSVTTSLTTDNHRLQHCRFIPIPRTATPARISSNADIYDFELSEQDMRALDDLDLGEDGVCSVRAAEMMRGP